MTSPRTGGQILVDQLITHGVKQLFCVPGESFLSRCSMHCTTRQFARDRLPAGRRRRHDGRLRTAG
jgi:hypothetical protein